MSVSHGPSLAGRVPVRTHGPVRSIAGVSGFTIMGIVNVTPDSFSDGGQWLDPTAAVAHGLELEAEGAAIVDVGGESTRPGAEPVGADEEIRRVQPVVEGLAERLSTATISIDTAKAAVAEAALAAGASLGQRRDRAARRPGDGRGRRLRRRATSA